MKILRHILAVAVCAISGSIATAQTYLVRNNQTNEVNASFSLGANGNRNTLTWKTGSTGVFNAGSTLTVNGIFQGTPTGGTLDLSLVTVIGVSGSGGISNGDKGDITVGGAGASLTIDNGAVTLAKMADMATASLLGRNTAGTGAPEVLAASTARGLLGLGGAALLNVGTTAGTVGAGDDSRFTDARTPTDGSVTTTKVQAATLVTASETIASNNNDTTIPTSAAVKAYADSVVGGGIGGNFSAVGNVIASSGNFTINSAAGQNIVIEPGAAGEVRVVGVGNVTGNLAVGGDLAVTGNSAFATVNATTVNPTSISGATAHGQVFIGNVTNGLFTKNVITAGDGISITNAAGAITINATGSGAGDVTAASAFSNDNRLIRSDGTGKGVQASNIVIDDSGNMSGVGTLSTSGINTLPGATIPTANAMGALAIDVTKALNTKTISADSTFTFSGTPATANTLFSVRITNSDSSEHTITIPSSFSFVTKAARTTMPIAASGKLHLTFLYDGSGYDVYGDPSAAGEGDLLAANNLSDLASASTARTNLGLVAVASSGSASDLSTGTVPDARFPATLPAASGVNLTALNGSNIASGTVADARIDSAIARDADFDTAAERYALGFQSTTYGGRALLQVHGAMGATETFDLANGNAHTGTLDANLTVTLTNFSNTSTEVSGAVIKFLQDATGGRTVTWPAEVLGSPQINPTAGSETIVTLVCFGSTSAIYAVSDYTTASSGDFSSNTASSVDSEIVLFSGTGGKTGKRATGTGIGRVASGVFSAAEISGDATTSGSNALTLATVNSNVGTFGSATAAPAVTVNAKGLVTAASNVTITPAVGSIAGLGTGVGTALAVNAGSSGAFLRRADRTVTFVLTMDDLADSMNYDIGFVGAAFTVTEIRAVHFGSGLSSPSIIATVKHGTDRTSGTTIEAVTATSSTTGTSVTSAFDDATVPADSFIWVETASKSGTTDNFTIIVRGTYD